MASYAKPELVTFTGIDERTDDWFDLAKCEQVLRAVYGDRP